MLRCNYPTCTAYSCKLVKQCATPKDIRLVMAFNCKVEEEELMRVACFQKVVGVLCTFSKYSVNATMSVILCVTCVHETVFCTSVHVSVFK